VTVGDVVDQLTYCPAALAIRGVELGVMQALHRGAKMRGELAQRFDVCRSNARKLGGGRLKRPMG
jgi:hypothetical protein